MNLDNDWSAVGRTTGILALTLAITSNSILATNAPPSHHPLKDDSPKLLDNYDPGQHRTPPSASRTSTW
jgi:hypothetical protein